MFQGCCKSFFFVVSVDLLLTIFFFCFLTRFLVAGAGTVLGGGEPEGGGCFCFYLEGVANREA